MVHAPSLSALLRAVESGDRPDSAEAMMWLTDAPLAALLPVAEALTLAGFGDTVSYSRKVFIPLTQLCRDVCHYCTFAKAPRNLKAAYLTEEEVLEIAFAGKAADCKEALFTLGDKPEARYAAARRGLEASGSTSTLQYLERVARRVIDETGLLPHLNPGTMDAASLARLRGVSASMGLMLESASDRLCERGGAHFGSPDKRPAVRLATLAAAGELAIPMTTGLLIGIGETRRERIESLVALRDLHEKYGHLQEIIIQNFKAKIGTKMARATEPTRDDQLWTIATARLLFGSSMSIQAPPNLQPQSLTSLLHAGVNDWGGVSPITPDHVNPEAPWPHLQELERATEAAGRNLLERLALVPTYAIRAEQWTDSAITPRVRRFIDGRGFARADRWYAGSNSALPRLAARWSSLTRRQHAEDFPGEASADPAQANVAHTHPIHIGRRASSVSAIIRAAQAGHALDEDDIVRLFTLDGRDLDRMIAAADELRHESVGDTVTYVVNRNINYTNICLYHCGFCAFSKGRGSRNLRGPAYNLELDEVARRTLEAADAGATEVCLQGGIHPSFTGQTYLDIVRAVKEAVPGMHVHAFSPLEILHGATTLGMPLAAYLERLLYAGLSTLPGTAAEILDDEIRAVICPDKLSSEEWLTVIGTAHEVGLRTTSTIMFGHVEHPVHWARHLMRLRVLQERTGGISEFVPLGFVHMEAPLWRKGRTRSGPTFREAVLMHAVPRLVLHPAIRNIQTSWVKMGAEGAALCLDAGANDLGGTLMNESITRAAGGVHGQKLDAATLQAIASSIGRPAHQRTTLYGTLHDDTEMPRRDPSPAKPSISANIS